ncbi:uncharacterized protein JCM6883_006963 [Sporobolomyces salmoneus]|uniref:uncharacterized protein n=1 Tax=Sporobolomyces salmoneus TaxID=183962 RepID=UPI00317CEC64
MAPPRPEGLYDPPPSSTSTKHRSSRSNSSRAPNPSVNSARSPLPSRPRSTSTSRSCSRSRSIPETLEAGFEGLENVARVVERDAQEVEKFGRTGREVVETVIGEYPELKRVGSRNEANGRARSERGRKDDGYDESTDAGERTADEEEEEGIDNRPLLQREDDARKSRVVPYRSLNSRDDGRITQEKPRERKAEDSIEAFQNDMDSTQERVDDLFSLLESLATDRYQLTGLTSHLQSPSPSIPLLDRSNSRRERKHLKKLVSKVSSAKKELVSLYSSICLLSPRYERLSSLLEVEGRKRSVSREFSTLNHSFAKVLDFVEDRAAEEKEDEKEGRRDERMLKRFEESEPAWDRAKSLAELKRVKEDGRKKQFDGVDVDSWVGKWMVEAPFTELDRTALQEIDVRENQKSTSKNTATVQGVTSAPDSNDRWGFGTFFNNVTHLFAPSQADSEGAPKHASSPSMLEMGHRSRSSHTRRDRKFSRSYELSHTPTTSPRRSTSIPVSEEDISTDSNEATDLEKQRRGLIPLKKTQTEIELDSTEIPYQVPSDDTSGYQETPEELKMDQKDRIETEHFWTPVVVVEWILVVIMIGYWVITRGMGYKNSLGNIQLGRIVGDDAWSDTSPSNSTASSTTAAIGTSTVLSSRSTVSSNDQTDRITTTESHSSHSSSIQHGGSTLAQIQTSSYIAATESTGGTAMRLSPAITTSIPTATGGTGVAPFETVD